MTTWCPKCPPHYAMRWNGTIDEEHPPTAKERWFCDKCGFTMEVLIGDTFQLEDVDRLAERHADVLRELALTRARRADAVRIAEERREEIWRLRDRFVAGYAARSKVTVEWLREHGQVAVACYCGESGCPGWQMVNANGPLAPPALEE